MTENYTVCNCMKVKYADIVDALQNNDKFDDVLTALNIGGDDYIKKPFTLNILLAKVKAILSRYEQAKEMLVEIHQVKQ